VSYELRGFLFLAVAVGFIAASYWRSRPKPTKRYADPAVDAYAGEISSQIRRKPQY
jgi:hypothetical protein